MPHEGQRYTTTLEKAHRKRYERVWSEFIQDLRLTEADSLDCVPRLVHDWMRVLKHPLKKVIIEKTTANAVRMRWLQKAFPNSYFIGLIRNGYAVAEGIRRKGRKSLSRGARHWNLTNKIMINDAQKIRKFIEIKYEDMVDNSEDTSKKLGEFLDIDHLMIYKAMTKTFNFSTISGQNYQPIKNLNMDSINTLSQAEMQSITEEAQEMLTFFKYTISN